MKRVQVEKSWYTSKVIWINTIAAVFFLAQYVGVIGKPVPLEVQAAILALIDIGLRIVTNTGIE